MLMLLHALRCVLTASLAALWRAASYRGGVPLVPELWLLWINVVYGLFVYVDFAKARHAHTDACVSDAALVPRCCSHLCLSAGRDVGDHAPAKHPLLQAGEAADAVARASMWRVSRRDMCREHAVFARLRC
jgi:hypothetical protein